MSPKILRGVRITAALIFFLPLIFYFVDFAGIMPQSLAFALKLQFVPAILAGAWLYVAAVMILTLLFGRIYCSAICPFGVMMDCVSHISGRGKKKNFKNKDKRYAYSRPHNVLRYSVLAIFTAAFFISGLFLAVMLLDPYSNFGRIAANIASPVYVAANNALAYVTGLFGSHALYKVGFASFDIYAFSFSAAVLTVVALLAFFKGRLYCNSVCPVGTFLGLFSRFSLFKIRIDQEKCTSCGICTMSCKSSCIEKGGKSIDYSRCVVCFDCIGGCKGHGITFSPGITGVKGTKHVTTGKNTPEDASRREFLATSAAIALSAPILSAAVPQPGKEKACANAGECINGDTCDFTNQCYTSGSKLPVTPAGSTGIEEFNAACTACNLCIVKCPSQVLKPAVTEYGLRGFMQPVMKYRDGHFCNYDCTVCSQVCPTGAIKPLTKEEKHTVQIGIAHFFPGKCVAVVNSYDCGACAEHCPTAAVHMKDNPSGGPRIPEVTPELCVGCGACEQICPEKAIIVYGNRVHRKAKLPVKEDALEIDIDDFGF